MEDIRIHPEATSHNENLEDFFTATVVPKLLEERVETALDIGAGEFCRHALYLAQKEIKTDIVEVQEQIDKMDPAMLMCHEIRAYTEIPRHKYDAVLLNYVLKPNSSQCLRPSPHTSRACNPIARSDSCVYEPTLRPRWHR